MNHSRIAKLALASAGLLTVALGFQTATRPARPAPPRKLEILFLGQTNPDPEHHGPLTATSNLVPVLAKEGINVTFTDTPTILNPVELAKYDALMIYGNHDRITPDQEKSLLDFVNNGKGLLAIHSASACFTNSPAYLNMVGGQFDKHKTAIFTANFTQPDHAILRDIEPWESWDETYIHKNHNTDRTVLMERVEDGTKEPWTWIRNQGKGRVFYTASGHDQRTWTQPAFLTMLRNATVWAVGDTTANNWSRLRLPPITRRASSYIPNYERRPVPINYQVPLDPEESIQYMQVPPGFEAKLFASEPNIVKPIAMTWDERGRLWIAETLDYPNNIHPRVEGQPAKPGNDRIKILEDTNGDGKADKFTVFADKLNVVTGLTLYNGGVLVTQAPDILFLKDTNGDGKADVRQLVLTGWGTRDTHAGPSTLRYGFDNHIWGTVGYSAFNGKSGDKTVSFQQAPWRMKADGTELEQMGNFSNNTWGLGFSESNDIFGSTANNVHAVYVGIPNRYLADIRGLPIRSGSKKIDGHYGMFAISPNTRQVDVFGGFTAGAGFNLYTARAFPKEYWDRIAFVSEPTGRVVHRAILEKQGAGYVEKDGQNLAASVDDWFGPVDAQTGPDGAVWIADFYNFIIQHNPVPMGFDNGTGNAYVNPLRDNTRGRIYRITYKGAPAYKPMSLSKLRPLELVKALENNNLFWRLTAQRLLVERGQKDVVPQLVALAKNQTVDELGKNPGALHALWTLEGLGMKDEPVVAESLKHPAAAVRKAALQVLGENENTLKLARAAGLLTDPDPHTRLAALLTVSRVPQSEELGKLLYDLGKATDVRNDEFLSQAVYIGAVKHRPGYLKSYEADLGAGPYRVVAQRLAQEESAPPVQGRGGAIPTPPPPAAVAERVLRAYVEDVVGPITRPTFGGRGGAGRGGQQAAGPAAEIAISTIPEQMKYTVTNFTVKPGQRVRITFTNPDQMQHNIVIARPGTQDAIAKQVTALASTSDAAERNYIPATPDVLFYTKLVDPGQSFTLEFVAPMQAGDYPYGCTFPGHWITMQGTMKVAP